MIIEMIVLGLAVGAGSTAGSHFMGKWLDKDKKDTAKSEEKPNVQEEKKTD